jgi:DNA-binding CsgD family transcriptional regulator
MSVRYRPMQPKDVRRFAEHIAAHPVLGPRYGNLIKDLPAAIRHVLGRDSITAVVFEEFLGSTTQFLGAGVAAFVKDDFLQEVEAIPQFWVGPEFAKRINGGNSPLLSDAEVRDVNSTIGLNLMVWHNSMHPADIIRLGPGTKVMAAFEESYRGFRLRELIAQADCIEHMMAMRKAGGLYFDRAQRAFGNYPEVNPANFSDEPRNVGITREVALTHAGSWVASLFLHAPPRFGLNRSEQRLLAAALSGGTDGEIADALGIASFTVKTTWRAIYDRVALYRPDLVPDRLHDDGRAHARGKQKKQRLLDYLREHPEELRPVSRKLRQKTLLRVRAAPKIKSALDTNS